MKFYYITSEQFYGKAILYYAANGQLINIDFTGFQGSIFQLKTLMREIPVEHNKLKAAFPFYSHYKIEEGCAVS